MRGNSADNAMRLSFVPTAIDRSYQDKRFAIEHFHTKLPNLLSGLQALEGAQLAAVRHTRLNNFLDGFMDEVGAPSRTKL